MRVTKQTSRIHFSDAARAAALEARRENAVSKESLTTPALYVVRQSPQDQLFGWEIRRFGGVILNRSKTGYPTQVLARSAGEETLLALMCS